MPQRPLVHRVRIFGEVLRTECDKLIAGDGMTPEELCEFCKIEPAAHSLLRTAMKQLNLTARAFQRVLKPARTIADLEASDNIKVNHLAEAIQYRPRTNG